MDAQEIQVAQSVQDINDVQGLDASVGLLGDDDLLRTVTFNSTTAGSVTTGFAIFITLAIAAALAAVGGGIYIALISMADSNSRTSRSSHNSHSKRSTFTSNEDDDDEEEEVARIVATIHNLELRLNQSAEENEPEVCRRLRLCKAVRSDVDLSSISNSARNVVKRSVSPSSLSKEMWMTLKEVVNVNGELCEEAYGAECKAQKFTIQ